MCMHMHQFSNVRTTYAEQPIRVALTDSIYTHKHIMLANISLHNGFLINLNISVFNFPLMFVKYNSFSIPASRSINTALV